MWASGEFHQSAIAKYLKVPEATVSKHFDRKGLKKGTRTAELLAAAEEEMKKTAVEEAALIALRIRETKEDHYKMASNLAKLTWAEILKAKSDGAPLSSVQANLKALETAMTVLKKAREERYAVLGLDKDVDVDEDDIPDLVVSELTEEQIAVIRANDVQLEELEMSAQPQADYEPDDESEDEDDGSDIVEED